MRRFPFYIPTLLLLPMAQTLGSLVLWLAVVSPPSYGQARPITPSGLNTHVSSPATLPSGQTQYNITGGTRPSGGANLFHSFGDFNVPNNNIANFFNDSGIPTSNILGRVTAGNVSNIFGIIQTTGFGGANLFLMNPAGFLFGPNATVNVGGMVAFTSADYLRLADGKLFNAAPNANSDAILSTSPVAAYGFLGSDPGAITVQGSQLTVTPRQSISLVGSNITIQPGTLDNGSIQAAKLSAQSGQINLASVASPGEILTETLTPAPNINGQKFGNLGGIQISEHSALDVSGTGGGTVLIRGGNFILNNSTITANVTGPGPIVNGAEAVGSGVDIQVTQKAVIENGALIETSVVGNATLGTQYGGATIKADRIEILGSHDSVNIPETGIVSGVFEESTGDSGNIILEANSILIRDPLRELATFVDASTEGFGNSGNISITAKTGNLEIESSQISTGTFFGADGSTGKIELLSMHGNIVLADTNIISQANRSAGKSSFISLTAPEGDVILATDTTQVGNRSFLSGGIGTITESDGSLVSLRVVAKNLRLSDDSSLSGDNFDPTPAGAIVLSLSGSLSLNDTSFIQTVSRGEADAAPLNITAHDVTVAGGSFLNTETRSAGDGGPLNISTENLVLMSGGQIRSGSLTGRNPLTGAFITPSGDGGTITVKGLASPAQSVLIDGQNSGLFTSTVGTGAGGNISINTSSLTVQNGGIISAATTGTTASAVGGMIQVNAGQIQLNNDGTMTAATSGPAHAGTISIQADDVIISGASSITSESTGSGNAGTVTIQGVESPAQSVLIDGVDSGVFTDTQGTGAGGNIFVNANTITLQNSGTLSAATSGTDATAIGGTITVEAPNSVTMTNGASITASSTGPGNTGNINITAGNQFAMTNSSVTTEATQSGGGIIKITTNPNGTVQLTDSTISASVSDGNGGGGSVNIDPQSVVLINSQILANAIFGPGGNISITTNLLLPDTTSVISASSAFGQQGTISIQSPVSPAGGKIFSLGQKPLIATSLLSQRCAALAGGNISSFTVAGRDTLPAEPDGWLSSPLSLSVSKSPDGSPREARPSGEAAEATPLLSLRRISPSGFLTQSFGVESSDCQS